MGCVGDETDLRCDDRRVEELLLLRIRIIVACQKLEMKFQISFHLIRNEYKFEKEKSIQRFQLYLDPYILQGYECSFEYFITNRIER